MAISKWLASTLSKAALQGVAPVLPPNPYVALYTGDPTINNTGPEVSGGGYVRQSVTFEEVAPVEGYPYYINAEDVTFPIATTSWDVITHVGIMTAADDGELMWYYQLDTPRQTLPGDNPRLAKGVLRIAFTE